MLRLALQEVLEGEVVETTSFGAFISLGPIDAMLHVSQISDEYITYDEKNGRLVCQTSGRAISVGDLVRARVVALSLNEREPRESKIGLTMRQSGLGTTVWLAEDLARSFFPTCTCRFCASPQQNSPTPQNPPAEQRRVPVPSDCKPA